MRSTQVRLARRPVGEPQDSDFEIAEAELPELEDGQVLLRVIHLSLDPYMRGRMSDAKSYAEPVGIGEVMVGETVCEVIDSRDESRAVGDIVTAYVGWQTHAVAPAAMTRKLVDPVAGLSTYLGVLGMPGFTAYAGLLQIGRPQPGETVVVAAATGPVGSAVGQIAKIHGARAVGVAGGPQKCRALIEEFGFDAAIDHRAPDFAEQLAAAVPDGIDVYFENVGGHVADAVYPLLNKFARVPVCGLIANYNATGPAEGPDRVPEFLRRVLTMSLTVRGFIQDEFVRAHYKDFLRDMSGWVADGSVHYREDFVDGIENAPAAFRGLLRGTNFGKLIVNVSEPPAA